jgi:hypothetical protein
MKRKRRNWAAVPWTPFEPAAWPPEAEAALGADIAAQMRPDAIFVNSRYQVAVRFGRAPEPIGDYVHLTFHVHDRQPHHDWRDMQRIKNELVGEEFEAVELFPDERRLVDTSNEYGLFVFRTWRPPFGWQERLVMDGALGKSRQRGWPSDARPADVTTDAIAALDAFKRAAKDTGFRLGTINGRLVDER